MTGSAGQRRVPEHFLADLDIFLPPLPEQKRIAAILDQADALRAKRRDALAKLDEMAQAIFAEMFGNASQAFQKWKTIVVRDTLIIPLRNGVSPASEGKVPGEVLTLSAVTGRLFNTKARKQAVFSVEVPVEKRVSASDLLICRGNGNANLVGRGFFPVSDMPDVAFPDTVIAARFSPQLFEPLFIQAIWNGKSVRNQIERHARTTNGTFKVNQTAIESIELIAPPIHLQRAFSNRMRSIQSAQLNLEQHSEKLDSLFLSLQHRAFSGDL
jgi:type I restriction enzyme S subunit